MSQNDEFNTYNQNDPRLNEAALKSLEEQQKQQNKFKKTTKLDEIEESDDEGDDLDSEMDFDDLNTRNKEPQIDQNDDNDQQNDQKQIDQNNNKKDNTKQQQINEVVNGVNNDEDVQKILEFKKQIEQQNAALEKQTKQTQQDQLQQQQQINQIQQDSQNGQNNNNNQQTKQQQGDQNQGDQNNNNNNNNQQNQNDQQGDKNQGDLLQQQQIKQTQQQQAQQNQDDQNDQNDQNLATTFDSDGNTEKTSIKGQPFEMTSEELEKLTKIVQGYKDNSANFKLADGDSYILLKARKLNRNGDKKDKEAIEGAIAEVPNLTEDEKSEIIDKIIKAEKTKSSEKLKGQFAKNDANNVANNDAQNGSWVDYAMYLGRDEFSTKEGKLNKKLGQDPQILFEKMTGGQDLQYIDLSTGKMNIEFGVAEGSPRPLIGKGKTKGTEGNDVSCTKVLLPKSDGVSSINHEGKPVVLKIKDNAFMRVATHDGKHFDVKFGIDNGGGKIEWKTAAEIGKLAGSDKDLAEKYNNAFRGKVYKFGDVTLDCGTEGVAQGSEKLQGQSNKYFEQRDNFFTKGAGVGISVKKQLDLVNADLESNGYSPIAFENGGAEKNIKNISCQITRSNSTSDGKTQDKASSTINVSLTEKGSIKYPNVDQGIRDYAGYFQIGKDDTQTTIYSKDGTSITMSKLASLDQKSDEYREWSKRITDILKQGNINRTLNIGGHKMSRDGVKLAPPKKSEVFNVNQEGVEGQEVPKQSLTVIEDGLQNNEKKQYEEGIQKMQKQIQEMQKQIVERDQKIEEIEEDKKLKIEQAKSEGEKYGEAYAGQKVLVAMQKYDAQKTELFEKQLAEQEEVFRLREETIQNQLKALKNKEIKNTGDSLKIQNLKAELEVVENARKNEAEKLNQELQKADQTIEEQRKEVERLNERNLELLTAQAKSLQEISKKEQEYGIKLGDLEKQIQEKKNNNNENDSAINVLVKAKNEIQQERDQYIKINGQQKSKYEKEIRELNNKLDLLQTSRASNFNGQYQESIQKMQEHIKEVEQEKKKVEQERMNEIEKLTKEVTGARKLVAQKQLELKNSSDANKTKVDELTHEIARIAQEVKYKDSKIKALEVGLEAEAERQTKLLQKEIETLKNGNQNNDQKLTLMIQEKAEQIKRLEAYNKDYEAKQKQERDKILEDTKKQMESMEKLMQSKEEQLKRLAGELQNATFKLDAQGKLSQKDQDLVNNLVLQNKEMQKKNLELQKEYEKTAKKSEALQAQLSQQARDLNDPKYQVDANKDQNVYHNVTGGQIATKAEVNQSHVRYDHNVALNKQAQEGIEQNELAFSTQMNKEFNERRSTDPSLKRLDFLNQKSAEIMNSGRRDVSEGNKQSQIKMLDTLIEAEKRKVNREKELEGLISKEYQNLKSIRHRKEKLTREGWMEEKGYPNPIYEIGAKAMNGFDNLFNGTAKEKMLAEYKELDSTYNDLHKQIEEQCKIVNEGGIFDKITNIFKSEADVLEDKQANEQKLRDLKDECMKANIAKNQKLQEINAKKEEVKQLKKDENRLKADEQKLKDGTHSLKKELELLKNRGVQDAKNTVTVYNDDGKKTTNQMMAEALQKAGMTPSQSSQSSMPMLLGNQGSIGSLQNTSKTNPQDVTGNQSNQQPHQQIQLTKQQKQNTVTTQQKQPDKSIFSEIGKSIEDNGFIGSIINGISDLFGGNDNTSNNQQKQEQKPQSQKEKGFFFFN